MEHGEDFYASFPGKEPAAQLVDPVVTAQKPVGGGVAKGDDDFGTNKANLRGQPLPAGGHFLPCGNAVPGRPALHHIGYVNLFSLDPRALQDLGEKLSSWANKRPARLVFHFSWSFADKHKNGGRTAFPKHHLGSGFAQWATAAGKNLKAQILQGWRKTGQGSGTSVLERATGIEPATFGLGRRRSTN